jgi:peptide-methionine (S)-S-oxide reductase
VFKRPIVTTVTADTGFFAAEDYHQDFLVNNPGNPYIVANDLPKIRNLEKLFPGSYLRQPVTVYAANAGR